MAGAAHDSNIAPQQVWQHDLTDQKVPNAPEKAVHKMPIINATQNTSQLLRSKIHGAHKRRSKRFVQYEKTAPLDQLRGNTHQTHTPCAQLNHQNHYAKPLLLSCLYAAYEQSKNSCRTGGLKPRYFVLYQVSPLSARNSTFLGIPKSWHSQAVVTSLLGIRQKQPE